MTLEKARVDFSNLQKRICAFNHATALIYYDGETVAPPDTVDNRTHSLEILNEEIFKLRTGEETIELLNVLDEHRDELSVRERRALDFMLKDLNRKKHIPIDEYVMYESYITEAQDAWHIAREENDFSIMEPKLEKVFDSLRNFAHYNTPDRPEYEYCLANYEEGLDIQTCDRLFDVIKKGTLPLYQKVREKQEIDDSCLLGDFSAESQEDLATYLMEVLGLNMNRVGLATAEHPFTTFLGSHFDERIATKYSRKNYSFSMYTVMNQVGHVLYDTGQADNLAYTVLDGGTSLALLESQGRFYENIVGKSRTFIEFIYPELEALFSDSVAGCGAENVYRAVNKVRPGLLRMDADELTFNLHIIVRYELEKAVLNNELSVKDLPEAWAQKYKEYLDVDVTDDVSGVLQDIHWPFGGIGYFPTYTLGNAISAQLAEKMREDIDVDDGIRKGDYSLINLWNKENIWKYGGLYTSKEIMQRKIGVEISGDAYIKYLTEKYSEIYNL